MLTRMIVTVTVKVRNKCYIPMPCYWLYREGVKNVQTFHDFLGIYLKCFFLDAKQSKQP